MKYLKALLLVIIAVFTFGSAMAQVAIQARVGDPHYYHHHYYHHYRHHHYYHHN
jgi:hypothetical protein